MEYSGKHNRQRAPTKHRMYQERSTVEQVVCKNTAYHERNATLQNIQQRPRPTPFLLIFLEGHSFYVQSQYLKASELGIFTCFRISGDGLRGPSSPFQLSSTVLLFHLVKSGQNSTVFYPQRTQSVKSFPLGWNSFQSLSLLLVFFLPIQSFPLQVPEEIK